MSTNNSVGALQLTIGSTLFNATPLDNPTVSAFISLLPLDLQMADLNENEKHADVPTTLPTAATAPGPIRRGDIMLYGSRTIVLWYEDLDSTTYTYTRIGTIDNLDGFLEAVGEGDVNVRITTEGSPEVGPPPVENDGARLQAYLSYASLWIGLLCLVYVLQW
ncbi:hypothetical protein F5X68DRAFT_236565 [Plectosphaerella plurivora]|uniref:Cyclophilin-like domain-containing protein n=1 Tax=Plectosphaerella plurivora TaxID=936078 RepID=A0A9P8V2U4_9PEZI|nr:hypothetical protein F5X68DRAFT_236565 [Plectosphaerella plurivora]